MWFATTHGLAVSDPVAMTRLPYPPQVRIEEVIVDGKPLPKSKPGELLVTAPPGSKRLQVRFTAPHFATSSKLRFQYHLDGGGANWVDVGEEQVVTLENLQPRSYAIQEAS